MGCVTFHGFGRDQTVRAPLANLTVCLSDVDCETVRELPIMCAMTDFCSHNYDVILPAAAVCNLQAKAVVSKGLCNGPTVRACCKRQPCANLTTADRLSSGTKMRTAVESRPRSSHADGGPKRNLGCGVMHGACAVVMLCILCVALIVCVALMLIDSCDVRFARVLTPAPAMLYCLSLSQRSSPSRQDDKMAHLSPEPRQERRQLLVMFADKFDDRPGICDARIHRVQATDGLVRLQLRPCRAPDLCPVSSRYDRRTDRWRVRSCTSSPHGRTHTGRQRKTVGVRIACDYGYLNSFTVGDAFLMPTIDEWVTQCSSRSAVT